MLSFSNGNVINLGNIKGSKGDKGDKGDSGLNGKDGVGIQNVDVTADGALTVTLTNGTVLNLGNIKGADGLGITKAEINTSGELVLTYSNGDVKNLGKVSGENGKDGANGADGLGIKSLTLSPDGELVVTMSDNSISNLGNIKGEKGEQGLQGDKGADGRGIAKTELVNGELVITYTDGTSDNLGKIDNYSGNETEGLDFYPLPDGTYAVAAGKVKFIENIVIPSTYKGKAVTKIPENGFKDSMNLKTIFIPNSIISIGKSAFGGCSNLKNVYYNGDLNNWLNIQFSNASANPCCNIANLYFDDELVTNVSIPEGIEKIPNYAFYKCNSITSINISSTVTTIGTHAFDSLNVTELFLPENVKLLELGSFNESKITKLTHGKTSKWSMNRASSTAWKGYLTAEFIVMNAEYTRY